MTNRERQKLEKILFYILGRRPDEFGLLLDPQGFVPLKELHKALLETEGFKNIRQKQLLDLFLIFKPERFEFLEEEKRVRVKPEFSSPLVYQRKLVEDPPRELFTFIKPRAWIRASEEGLAAETIVLASEKELASRIAKRRGALVLSVDTQQAMRMGTIFEVYLEKLFLTSWIPAQALFGPKVDENFKKQYEKRPSEKKETERISEPLSQIIPEEKVAYRKLTHGRKKEPAWKKRRRQRRRR